MFNEWLTEAESFFERLRDVDHFDFDTLKIEINRPASKSTLQKIEKGLRLAIPDTFREIYLNATSAATLRYTCDVGESLVGQMKTAFGQKHLYAGGTLFDIESLPAHLDEIEDGAEMLEDEGFDEHVLWRRSFPFLRTPNGDFLAVDLDTDGVVYLGHENGSLRLTKSLESFLSSWSLYAYAGPEWWILDKFRGAKGLLIKPSAAQRKSIRLLFPHIKT